MDESQPDTPPGAAGTTNDADLLAATHTSSLDRIAGDLGAVETAMRRLDEGTYGRCEACGAEIPEDLLASAPLEARCAQHRPSEGTVGVLTGDDPLAFGGEHPER